MKGKDDLEQLEKDGAGESSSASSRLNASKSTPAPHGSSLSSFIHQEQLCKELYLSMGVHPSDIADTSDDDVASILEQMSRLHSSGKESDGGGDRNIEDILREAESLLDVQSSNICSRSKSSYGSSRSGSGVLASSHGISSASAKLDFGDEDVHSSSHQSLLQARLLGASSKVEYSSLETDGDAKLTGCHPHQQAFAAPRQKEESCPSHISGTPLEVTYKRICEQIRKEVDGSLKSHLTGDFPDFKLSLPIPGLDTPSFDVPGCFNLEQEFLEERKRCLKLKADLDWLKRQHEHEVADLRRHHEGQLNQVREELRCTVHQDPSVLHLQDEIKAQERIINNYKQENVKVCTELKDIKRLLLKLMALLKTDSDSVCVFP